jgi:hypothetical protein
MTLNSPLSKAVYVGLVVILGCGGTEQPAQSTANAAGASGSGMPASGSGAGSSSGAGAAGTTTPSGRSGSPAAGSSGSAAPLAGSGSAGADALPVAGQAGGTSAGASGAAAGSGGAAATAPALPPVTSTDKPGPFETVQDLQSGPRRASGVFRPKTLGENGLRHPLFVWGCGGGSNPASYADHMNRIASHGFVVISEVSAIGDDGTPLTAALDWLIAENGRADSAFYQHLDTTKVAVGGHSIGSVNSFLVADDARWTTTIHVAGGSLDDVNDPFAPTTGMGGKSLVHPVAYICAETDAFGNTEKTAKDYESTTVPVFFTVIDGADHVGAARDGLPVMVAWLRWQLGGETDRRASFLDPQGEFHSGKFVSQSKNW